MSDASDDTAFKSSPPAASARQPSRGRKSVYEKTRSGAPLASINTVLNNVVSGLGLERRLRENALISLWPQVVGETLAPRSRPLFIDIERNLVVAAASGSVAQELSLMKPQLMRHLTKLAASLNVEVKGIRLDLKHFHKDPFDTIAEPPPVPPAQPEAEELEKLNLSPEDTAALTLLARQLDETNSGVDDNPRMRSRILRLYERELRIRVWRRQQNYPVCQHCGDPAPRLHTLKDFVDNRRVCPACLYTSYAPGTY
jgi:hypothetical protein